jgi:hypothetical protein
MLRDVFPSQFYPTINVIILPVVFWQGLFLVIAVAWDAFLFHNRLRVKWRTSIEYAISINLLTNVVGWIVLFVVLPIVPLEAEVEILSYMFFNQLFKVSQQGLQEFLLGAFASITLATTVIKFLIVRSLQALLQNFSQPKAINPDKKRQTMRRKTSQSLLNSSSEFTVILISNLLINLTLSGIIFLRFLRGFTLPGIF